jgi:serine/threonine-protein kinase
MEPSDKYKIIEPLGKHQGRKFGSLFLVTDKSSGELGVMKVVAKSEGSKIAVERLRGEATFDFDVSGLPKIFDFYESDSEVILIRKYVDAIPLSERFNAVKRRNRHVFLCQFLHNLGKLLKHLHDRNIYHCDLKPGNILIDENESIHLIDFGLAIQQPLQASRKMLFPLGYAAPELLLNHLNLVDHRTDYFALGITLWRLYTGKLPLVHANPSIFTNLQLTHPLPESDEVPKHINKVLLKMCAKHSFKSPPNTMVQKEVETLLKEAMQLRYTNFDSFLNDFQNAGNRSWFTRKYRGDTPY